MPSLRNIYLTTAAILAAFGASAIAAATAPATPQALEVVQRTVTDGVLVARLANGMTVIVKEHRAAPVVTVMCYVRAGGLYEGRWLGCGLSHLVEHLVAKGAVHESQSRPGRPQKPSQTVDRVSEIGGQSNAYTSQDHTCYYISATASRWRECIDLITDWMARTDITEEDFRREHEVVQRELEKGKDEPARQAWYAHASNVYAAHPAAVPVIGYPGPLRDVTLDDVRTYHKLMYVPQNMVFVVVGDIDAGAALVRTAQAFAGFEQGRDSDFSLPEAPAFSGVRRVTRRHAGMKETIEYLSFQSIPLIHDDLYALDVLAYVLGTGKSSRLYRVIQRKQKLVTSISCSSWTPAWGKGIFTVRFRAEPSKVDQAEKAILAELHKVVAEEVEPAELERAKRQKIADDVYSRQTADSIASSLARDYMTTGDVHFSKNYTKRIKAVTAGQILSAARKYIKFDRMAITRLASAFASQDGAETKDRRKREAQVFTLRGGLRVVLKPDDSGLVSMVLAVKGGLLGETRATNGLGALATSLTTKGTENYSAARIAAFFDKAGGSISGNSGNNTFYWRATVLQDSFDEALTIFADVIVRPTFEQKELDTLRPVQLARIKRSDENLMSQLSKFFRSKFFAGKPYGMHTLGRAEVVRGATTKQIRQFYSKSVAMSGGVLAICGQFKT
ncbi:MAG: insulinase family protein, partial [Planctomycetes bacterium]|nr:insulinase family protein [Planctomycetota bacterium]